MRSHLINQGKLDKMSKLQSIAPPALKIGDRIQYAFRYADEENEK